MSVTNAPTTQRQCPRCRKVQSARASICEGCGRRFQVPPPEPLPIAPSGVYAWSPPHAQSREDTRDAEPEQPRPISAWWGPAATALLVTPLGWVLLPLMLLLCLVTAALSLTVLPTLLAVIASLRLRTARLPAWQKGLAMPLLVLTGLGLNVLLWHLLHQLAFSLTPPP